MKLVIVLFAVLVAVNAAPGWHHEPVAISNPWQPSVWPSSGWQPSVWPSSGWQPHGWQPHGWQPQGWQPSYVKVALPVHKVHHPQVHHVINVPQPHPIPPLHPKPLDIKVHDHPVRIPYHAPHVPHPHLVGVEHYVHEPEVKVVAKHHHEW